MMFRFKKVKDNGDLKSNFYIGKNFPNNSK